MFIDMKKLLPVKEAVIFQSVLYRYSHENLISINKTCTPLPLEFEPGEFTPCKAKVL